MEEQEQQEGNQAGNQAGSADAEARISELLGQIRDLKTHLDRRDQIERQAQENAEQIQQQNQQNLGYDPNSDEVKQWAPWLAPKIAPFLAERDRVIIALADKIDELETMRKFPEYGEEEYQSKVTKFIRETKKNRNITLSRVDAITFLKGQENMAKGGQQEEGNSGYQSAPISRARVSSPVESGTGLGTTRAAQNSNQKDPNELSIEEFESQFGSMKV